MKLIKRICEVCGKIFEAEPYRVRKHKAKYCSRKCCEISGRGKKQSSELIEKRIAPLRGRKRVPFSEEWKKNIGLGGLGRIPWNKGLTKETNEIIKRVSEDPERRRKIGDASRGEKNYFYGKNMSGENNSTWRGGISFEPYGIEFNDELKKEIRSRDNHTCQLCKKRQNGRAYDVHHIDYNKKNNDSINLITLCHSCHSKASGKREYWTDYFQTMANPNYRRN